MPTNILKPGFTNRDREWSQHCESAIRQGGARLPDALSDHGGHPPVDRHWASVANAIVRAKVRAPTRQMMMAAWLAHPDRPNMPADLRNSVLCEAVRSRAHESIPLLHAAGFAFLPDSTGPSLVAKELKLGRWPHPDMIAPDITSLREHHFDLAEGVFSPNSLRSPNFAKRLVALSPSDGLTRRISRWMGRAESNFNAMTPTENQQAQAVFAVLATSGWLDLGQAAREAHEQGGPRSVLAMIATVQTRALERTTATATARPPRSGLRL